jgi:hypothetical protein
MSSPVATPFGRTVRFQTSQLKGSSAWHRAMCGVHHSYAAELGPRVL